MKVTAAAEVMHEEEYENDVQKTPSTASMLRDYRIKGRSSLKKRLSFRAPRRKQTNHIVYSRFRDISSQKDPTHKMHDTVSEFIGVLAGPEMWHKQHPMGMNRAKLDRCEWMPKPGGSNTYYDDKRDTIETRTMDTINSVATAGMGSFAMNATNTDGNQAEDVAVAEMKMLVEMAGKRLMAGDVYMSMRYITLAQQVRPVAFLQLGVQQRKAIDTTIPAEREPHLEAPLQTYF